MGCKGILIVEDDPSIRRVMRELLELEGYSVQEAENGEIGLQKLHDTDKPCLILLDMMMPIMNGWDFIVQKQADGTLAEIPVVVLSAFTDKEAPTDIQGVLSKPIDIDALLDCVQMHCH